MTNPCMPPCEWKRRRRRRRGGGIRGRRREGELLLYMVCGADRLDDSKLK